MRLKWKHVDRLMNFTHINLGNVYRLWLWLTHVISTSFTTILFGILGLKQNKNKTQKNQIFFIPIDCSLSWAAYFRWILQLRRIWFFTLFIIEKSADNSWSYLDYNYQGFSGAQPLWLNCACTLQSRFISHEIFNQNCIRDLRI